MLLINTVNDRVLCLKPSVKYVCFSFECFSQGHCVLINFYSYSFQFFELFTYTVTASTFSHELGCAATVLFRN